MKLVHTHCRLAACFLAAGLSSCTSTPETETTTSPIEGEPQAEAVEDEVETPAAVDPGVEEAAIKTLEFKIEIAAPVEKVWDTMLSPEGYAQWTKPFMSGSYFQGTWAEGERMHFLAPGNSGMVAEIATNRLHERISIKHIGYVVGGVEDTTSEGVLNWAPAYENYSFASVPGGTVVTIEHEVFASFEGYMNTIWPKALDALKTLCEGS